MNERHKSEIDPYLFRRVMGRFASGVTVITVRVGDEIRGMTASAFMSGSLEPPLCVVSVAKRAHTHALLLQAGQFGVSILAEGQERTSVHFAGRPVAGLEPSFEFFGPVPLLSDACARIAAATAARHDCGDHTLFVGRILHMDSDDRPPLIYHSGRYGALLPRAAEDDAAIPEYW